MDEVASSDTLEVAQHWCERRGKNWSVQGQLGKGGTARVFEIECPDGIRALKIYDPELSRGERGEVEKSRIEKQLKLRGHDCPSLVQVYEGGAFEERLFLLMGRPSGAELAKRLTEVPRDKIRQIVDQIARAVEFLRSRGLCHRDIKAENIFVSDNFAQATLLDISVVRDIHDPVGAGTDRDGQLPVVATARYSPPEYLFRLEDSGPDLWHALNIYQLGALLHDLIMREELFEAEYRLSSENRYRFAWIIARVEPVVEADDVDEDLVFTAQCALDKDWKRRSSLTPEDFMADSSVRESHALELLGLTRRADNGDEGARVKHVRRIRNIAQMLSSQISANLREERGVKSTHGVKRGSDDVSWVLDFEWKVSSSGAPERAVRLELKISMEGNDEPGRILCTVSLLPEGAMSTDEARIEIPPVEDGDDVTSELAKRVNLCTRSPRCASSQRA